jgi:TolB-like protein/Tfp pilus assembly protein PilF
MTSGAGRKLRSGARGGARAKQHVFRLSLLGPFRLIGPKGAIDLGSKKLCALVAFLACNGPATREKLMSLLWGSHQEAQARQNLRKALSRMRQVMGEEALVADDINAALRPEMIECDVPAFERLAGENSRDSLRKAVDLYRETFLADVSISEEDWAEWLRAQRGRIEGLLVGALVRLAGIELQQHNPEQALEIASKAVSIDNLREDAHRLAIRALAATGRKAEALRRYDQLAALLKAELSTEPDARTRALIEEIRKPAAIVVDQPAADARTSDLPSIAVLPFRSIGGDRDADYFGDGMVEDIVVSLGSLHELFVISRGSTLAFRGKDPDPREIGRALGVRYVVGGSVQRSGKRVRVFVELCEAETGTAIWTDRTEAPLDDLFDIQDSYTASFASRIAPHIRAAELRRALRKRPETMTAYDYVLRGLEHVHRDSTFDQAGACFQKAIEREPTFALPYAWSGWWRSILIRQGWSKEPVKDWMLAAQMSAKAIDLDSNNALALASYGHLKSVLERDYDGGELFLESAVQACPSGPVAWVLGSFTQSYQGRGDEAIRRANQALKLSPLDRGRFYCHLAMGLGHYVAGRYDDAVKWGKLSAMENPGFTSTLRYLAAAHTAAGEKEEAKKLAGEVLKREPNFRLSNYVIPFRDKALNEQHRARLREAGLPE